MAIRFINSVHAALGSAGGTTGAIDTTGATLLVGIVGSFNGTVNFSDSKNNVWTRIYTGGSTSGGMWYSLNPTVGPGHTFTSNAGNYPSIIALAFAGVGAIDSGINGTNEVGGTSAQFSSMTASAPGDLFVTMLAQDAAETSLAIDSGFTITDSIPYSAGVNYGGAAAYLIQTSPVAISPKWSWSGSTNVRSHIQAFKSASAPLGTLAVTAGLTLQQNDLSQDFLHLTDSLGNVIGWIDSLGLLGGTLAAASTTGITSVGFNTKAVLSIAGNGNDDYMQFCSNTSTQSVISRITAAGVYTLAGNPTNRALKKVFIDNGSAAFGTTNFLVLRTNLYDTLNSVIGWIDQFGNLGGTL